MTDKNIVLTGFMGVGKSLFAQKLSLALKRPVVSTDAAIESQEGKTIPQIFEAQGEKHFRSLEAQVVKALEGVLSVEIKMTSHVRSTTPQANRIVLPLVKNVIAVASGK